MHQTGRSACTYCQQCVRECVTACLALNTHNSTSHYGFVVDNDPASLMTDAEKWQHTLPSFLATFCASSVAVVRIPAAGSLSSAASVTLQCAAETVSHSTQCHSTTCFVAESTCASKQQFHDWHDAAVQSYSAHKTLERIEWLNVCKLNDACSGGLHHDCATQAS